MSEKKDSIKNLNLTELEELLSGYETTTEPVFLEFGNGETVETDLFTFTMPQGFTANMKMDGFEVVCYKDSFEVTPMQITVKSEPMVLISPEEHYEKLKMSILNNKGMVMKTISVGDKEFSRFDLPTLGGRQMYFPLYHTTEVFSLRINFVGKVENAEALTEQVLDSFTFKEFIPRVRKDAVDSICNVFWMNRSKFAEDFKKSKETLASPEDAMDLCQNYGGALFGCIRVLDDEVRRISCYDVEEAAWNQLVKLGEGFCNDMKFRLEYNGETFSLPIYQEAEAMIAQWKNIR